MILHLALCHHVTVDKSTLRYNASSPDEIALVSAAKHFGVEFMRTDETGCYLVNYFGKEMKFKVLNILEFSSARKRMSIILHDM